jgi:hypothetical protein
MIRMGSLFTIAVLVLGINPESDIALADLAKQPHPYHAYLTLSTCPLNKRDDLAKLLRFTLPSLSSKTYLADQLPQPVSITRKAASGHTVIEQTNLLRVDLVGLGWEHVYAKVISQHYPYRPDLKKTGAVPVVVDGLWFAANVMDPIETGDAQYQLLYQGKPPKNRDEFLKFWGIGNDPEFSFGIIAEESGVSVEGTRQFESRPAAKRNYGWGTSDSDRIAGKFDPLEVLKPIADLPHKAEEWIAGMPKVAAGESGCLQAYYLSTDQGVKQDKAPANIVEDNLRLRGGVEIRNTSGCITCHPKGINEPTIGADKKYADGFRRYIESGARVGFYDKNKQRDVDRYFGSNLRKEILHHQSLYADGVKMCNGMAPEDNAANFFATVKLYDAPVDIEQGARELYTTPQELKFAIADYTRLYPTSTGRLADMPYRPMSRSQWVENFALAQYVVELWKYQK